MTGKAATQEAAGSESTATINGHISMRPTNESTNIASIPPELLAVIFEMALSKRRVQHKLPFEVILSHVSSLWRAVAITTPALWTRIDIYSSQSSDCTINYLRRSGSQMLLDIRVDIYDADKRFPSNLEHRRNVLIQSIVKTLFPHIHRARSLLILACLEVTALSLLSHLNNSVAPHLQRLRVNVGHPAMNTRSASFKVFSKGLPQLTFLETDLPHCMPLSLRNLTTLHLHTFTYNLNLSYTSFVAMITASPSLCNLSIKGSLNPSRWPSHVNGPAFSMDNLKALFLPDDSLLAARILLAISAPKLESLWLGSSFGRYSEFFNAPQIIGGHIKFPALKYLTIPCYNLYYCTEFSSVFPTVTHLYLPYANIFDQPQFKTTFASYWRYLETLVVASIRRSQMLKIHRALCHVLPLRRDAGYPIRQLLVDEDICNVLNNHCPSIRQYIKINRLSLETYREPWWIMSHERHTDHP